MTKEWFKAAGIRALRTFIQVVLAVWTAGKVDNIMSIPLITEVNWKIAFITAGTAAVYSILTSIVTSLPEVQLQDTLYALDNQADEEYMAHYDEIVDCEEGDE